MEKISGKKRPPAKPVTAFRTALTRLHLADQKAIFSGMPAAIMAALWRDRLEESIRKSRTRQQKDVLKQIADQITPGVYDRRSPAERKRFLSFYRKFQPTALAAFGADAARFRKISTLLGEGPTTAQLTQAAAVANCDCSLAAKGTGCDDCLTTNCKRISCTSTAFGCGCWWASSCDGICK